MGLDQVTRFDLPSFDRGSGVLTVVEDLPFPIMRAFFIAGVPAGGSRGGHANRDMHVFIAASGSFDLFLDDGRRSTTRRLHRPGEAIYVPPLIWRELRNFSADATCLVFSDRPYSHDDYISDYRRFTAEALGTAEAADTGSVAERVRGTR